MNFSHDCLDVVGHSERDLPRQRFHIGKFFFVAQFMQKIHAHMFVVNLARKIEQMNLQHRLAVRSYRRAHAQTGDTLYRLPILALHSHHKYTGQRRTIVFHLNISGRETDALAQTIAMLHTSADTVGAPEIRLSQFHPAFSQRRAHCGTGNAHAVMQHAVHRLHLKTMLCADLCHQTEITAAPAAETEIIADQYKFCPGLPMQRMHKIRCAHLRKALVEAAHMHAIHAK